VQQWQLNEELFRVRVCELVCLEGPLAALKVQTITVDTRIRLGSDILPLEVILDNELKAQSVNSYLLATRLVLQSCSQESLWEEES
jgi:hypothetical protein